MANQPPPIHVCDDWISIPLPNWESILAAQAAFSVGHHWTEIVPGLDSIAVQFNPALVSPNDAATMVRDQLDSAVPVAAASHTMVTIPVCYEGELAPDREFVANKLGIATEALPAWHASRMQRVAMLGFMPGFAYLESTEPCPAIGRLANPRQLVKAGSIGIIGRQSCIYSFDSPGGWPIIGRTPLCLFDPSKKQSALLSAGQTVRFECISQDAFENWPQANGS
jgi:inhibitor of KinA